MNIRWRQALNRIRSEERGSDTVELAIQMVLWPMFFAIVIAGGRLVTADHSVETAATDAARSASISRTATDARSTGIATARHTLANQGLPCRSTTVTLDTSEFAKPPGQPAKTTATVTCQVTLSDLLLPGIPGSVTMTKTMTSPIDTFRERR